MSWQGVAESGAIRGQDDPVAVNEGYDEEDVPEAVDHSISFFEPEPVKEEETMSPLPPEQSPEPVEEVGPSSPPWEQTIILPSEPLFQTLPVTVSTPNLRARFYERFVVRASQPSLGVHLSCSSHPFFKDVLNIPQDHKDFF